MEIRTTIAVDYNIPGKVNQTGNDIVYGKITDIKLSDFETLDVDYCYFIRNVFDQGLPTEYHIDSLISSGSKPLSSSEVEAIKQSVLPIPQGLTEMEEMSHKYVNGLRHVMAQTFSITVAETEIVP